MHKKKFWESEEFKDTSYFLADSKLLEYSMSRIRIEDHNDMRVDKKAYIDLEQELFICLSIWSFEKQYRGSLQSKFMNWRIFFQNFLITKWLFVNF